MNFKDETCFTGLESNVNKDRVEIYKTRRTGGREPSGRRVFTERYCVTDASYR